MNLEPAPLENRSLPLKDQIINRVLQLNPAFHKRQNLEALKDHALLTTLELAVSMVETRDFDDWYKHAFDGGYEYALNKFNLQKKGETQMSQDAFDILDSSVLGGLIPEQDLSDGGTYIWICNYAGGRFFAKDFSWSNIDEVYEQ